LHADQDSLLFAKSIISACCLYRLAPGQQTIRGTNYTVAVDRLSGYLMGKRFLDDDAMNDENKYHEDHRVTYAVAAHARILTSSFSF
jgi:hypothetical protein